MNGNDIEFSGNSPRMLKYPCLSQRCIRNDYMSYDMPAMAVNKAGVICTGYARWGISGSDKFSGAAVFFIYETNHIIARVC